MADIASTLTARLLGYQPLSALIGNRVFPGYLPQGTLKPAMYYEQRGFTPVSAMGTDAGIEETEWDLCIIADSYSSLKAVQKQVKAAVQRWKTTTGFRVLDTFITDLYDGYVDETEEHLSTISIKIQHQTA
ncbi:MAG: DUF3168 domain-containing protein [Chlorobiaceae bacterium]|nr:DUF3168 domain-containing protein [Chlorobiaceae bacterium]